MLLITEVTGDSGCLSPGQSSSWSGKLSQAVSRRLPLPAAHSWTPAPAAPQGPGSLIAVTFRSLQGGLGPSYPSSPPPLALSASPASLMMTFHQVAVTGEISSPPLAAEHGAFRAYLRTQGNHLVFGKGFGVQPSARAADPRGGQIGRTRGCGEKQADAHTRKRPLGTSSGQSAHVHSQPQPAPVKDAALNEPVEPAMR